MGVIAQVPTNPIIRVTIGTVTPGVATAFRGKLNAILGSAEGMLHDIQAYHEQLVAFVGHAAIGGGTIAVGSGLSVTISPGTAFVGNIVAWDAPGTVGGLVAGTLNYIFLRQDGAFSVNQAGTVPGTADGHGTAALWGRAVTDGTSVISIDNQRPMFAANLRAAGGLGTIALGTLAVGGTVMLTNEQAALSQIVVSGTQAGTVHLVTPLMQAGVAWAIDNQSASPVTFQGTVGSGIVIAGTAQAGAYSAGTAIKGRTGSPGTVGPL